MEYIIRHQFRDIIVGGKEFYVTSLFKNLYQSLVEKNPQHTFKIEVDQSYEDYGSGGIYSCMSLSIINPINNTYILISLFDNWKYHFMKHVGWEPKKMKQFFYAGGFNFLDYFNNKVNGKNNIDLEFPDNIESIYNCFFYNPYFDCCYNELEEIYNNRNKNEKIRKLFFRGWVWDFRKLMTENIEREDIVIKDKLQGHNQNLNYLDYLNEMNEYVAGLGLPGATESCNRDIECFAIGVPVLRPHLQINYPDPLIPNFHYVNVYHHCDYSSMGHPKYISYSDYQKNLEYTWDMVKNNDEYLNFVSQNARKWFVDNCTMEKNINLLLNKINLELLN
jgi:hypothetical protein